MKKEVFVGNKKIIYNLNIKNVKNINLRFNRKGEINVSAHKRVPLKTIENFIILNSSSIFKTLKKISNKINDNQKNHYIDNEEIEILGKKYKILIIKNNTINKITLNEQNLIINTCLHINKEDITKMVEKYLFELSSIIFNEIAKEVYGNFKSYAKDFPTIRVKNMVSRWGSLSYKTNGMSLNKKLVHMPKKCITYVIIHEFVHYIVKDHSKSFYEYLNYFVKKQLKVSSYLEIDYIFKKYEKKYM